ncbi:MAG: 4-hydroxy-3-methylbut-2-enyl diphosphate reductase [Epsilonproteobacteria bacterium]|nr:4-hydroxy-3-methylbut-2-enyl diphosphate reductase [Campylobacterota bacterium]
MRLILSNNIGFCYGVKRAVGIVDELSSKYKVKTFGPLIHNPQMIERLRKKGVQTINSVNDKTNKDYKIVIRSHGVGPDTYNLLNKIGIDYIDATCPFVKNAQDFVKRKSREKITVLIFGDKQHPEVKAVMSYAKDIVVAESIEEVRALPNFKKIAVVSQTTQSKQLFRQVVMVLLDKAAEVDIYNSICGATESRQTEAEKLSCMVDIMLIVGGKNSANTRRLYTVCQNHCETCYHIETVRDIGFDLFPRNSTIGLITGASTPDFIVDEIIDAMEREFGTDLSVEALN